MKITLLTIGLTLSLVANAEWTGQHKIKTMKAQGNGVIVFLDGFVNDDDNFACNTGTTPPSKTNQFFFKQAESGNYDTRISFLLSAYMQQIPVVFSYYSCSDDGPYINAGSIQLSTNYQ